MAPTSYQSPHVGDKADKHSYSQSAESNLSHSKSTVAMVLDQKGRDVVTVRPTDTIVTVVETLRDNKIGAVVVTDQNGTVKGILSERDIVRRLADTPGHTLPQKVEDLMTREVQVCSPEDPLFEVLKHMSEGAFRHMPVMEGDALVGIITVGDVVGFRLNELEYEALRMRQMIVG